MKKVGLTLLCLFVTLMLIPNGNCLEQCKEPKAPLARNMGKIFLGLSLKEAVENYDAGNVTEQFKSAVMSSEELIFSFPQKYSPTGAMGLIGIFYKNKLWRLEATFPPDYTKKISWKKFLKKISHNCYTPEKSSTKLKNSRQRIFKWHDSKTVLSSTKDTHIKPKNTFYYLSVEDVLPYKQIRRNKLSKQNMPAGDNDCFDYSSCYNYADKMVKQGNCREGIYYYTQAIKYDPDNPRAWHHRAIIKKKMGWFKYAKKDFDYAVKLDKSFKEKDDGLGLPKDAYGTDVRCSDK